MLLGWKLVTFYYALFVYFILLLGIFSFFTPLLNAKISLNLVIVSPLSSWICDNFSDFLCFSWLWQFWKVKVSYFVEWLQFECVWCFPYGKMVVHGFWEEFHKNEVSSSSHHIGGGVHDSNMTYTQVVLILIIWSTDFSDIKLLCAFSLSILWKWVTKSSPHSWSCFFKSN